MKFTKVYRIQKHASFNNLIRNLYDKGTNLPYDSYKGIPHIYTLCVASKLKVKDFKVKILYSAKLN